MRLTWLAWYLCGLFGIVALLASAVTYHPDAEQLSVILPAVSAVAAIAVGGVAIGLGRLPPTHRLHQSPMIWSTSLAAAITVTLILLLIG